MRTFRFYNEIIIEADDEADAKNQFSDLAGEFIKEVEVEEIEPDDIEEREDDSSENQ